LILRQVLKNCLLKEFKYFGVMHLDLLGNYFVELFVNSLCLRLKIRVGSEPSSLYFVCKIMGRRLTRVGCFYFLRYFMK